MRSLTVSMRENYDNRNFNTSPKITMSVIDAGLRFPQCAKMYSHEEIMAELKRQLGAGIVKAKDVAKALGIPAPRVTEMRKGDRRIQPHEMAPLADYLGMANLTGPQGMAQVIELWTRIPADRRPEAIRSLSGFAKRSEG